MEIREADIEAMGRAELEELIDRAVRPDVPLRVLFAALDRYTELLLPVLEDEPAPAPAPEPGPGPVSAPVPEPAATPAKMPAGIPASLVLPVAPGPPAPAGSQGPPE